MKLEQIDPINTPHRFFMPRIDGEDTIYDQVAEDTSEINDCLRSLKKKVYGGEAEFKMYADHIEIEYNGLTVAKADLIAEYFTTSWQSVAFDFSSASITKLDDGTFRFVMIQGDNTFGLEWSFAYGIQTKQTFYLDIPGRDVRIKWRTEVLENALAVNRDDNKGLKYSIDDYNGEVTHISPDHPDEGWAYHIWTFEPDGYTCDAADSRTSMERFIDEAGLVVDPYLEIDEQSTYIDVTCDGYTARIYSGGSEVFIGRIYDPDAVGTTAWFTFGSKCVVGGTTYALSEDTGITVTIIENTPTRCIIQMTGDFEDSSQGSLANESGSSLLLVFYPDRFTQEIQFVNSGTITLSDSVINGFCFMEAVVANIASEDAIYENVGSESAVTSDAEYNSADYIGITSTELNIIGINLEETNVGTSSFGQYVDDPEGLRFRWNNGTLTTGTHTMAVMWIIDSAEREDSVQLYDAADRLEQGIQYTNPSELIFNTGSAVTSGTGHTSIGTDGFASDGAYHIEGESGTEDEMSVDLGQIEHKPNVVLHDFPFTSGDGAIDYLIGHWKCDDDAANMVIIDSTGNNNGTLEGGDNTEDIQQGTSLLLNGTDDFINLSTAISGLTAEDELTVQFQFKPHFSFDGGYQYIFGLSNSDQRVRFQYDGNNFRLVTIGNSDLDLDTIYTSNINLQQWFNVSIAVSNIRDKMEILISNGDGFNVISSIGDWSSVLTHFILGAVNSSGTYYYSNIEVKNIKLIDAPIFPYGAYFTGNTAAQLSAGMYHKDILFYWDGSDCELSNTVQIPDTLSGVVTGNGTFETSGGIGDSALYNNVDTVSYISFPITSRDILDERYGSISGWVNVQTIVANDYVFGFGYDLSNHISMRISDSGTQYYLSLIIVFGGTTTTPGSSSILLDANVFQHFKVTWNTTTGDIAIYINGVLSEIGNNSGTISTSSPSYLYLGARYNGSNSLDCLLDEIYVTNNPNTPQIPTANGVPLDAPIMRND